MSENKDDISKLLDEYKEQKENKAVEKPLEPPKKRDELIDFAKSEPESEAKHKKAKKEKPEKSSEEIEALKQARKEKLKKISKKIFSKKVLFSLLAITLAAAVGFGIKFGVSYSKTAYLKPYEEKYPDVEFPAGILEKYCDDYGSNPETMGYISISDTDTSEYLTKNDMQPIADINSTYNYVVYLDSKELEQHYKNADAYNGSYKEIFFSNLYEDFTFEVAGAFYTNTKPEDDDGYIFPYNTTEKMTFESTGQFIERINTRLLYTVKGVEIKRADTLLTLSCPTDYRDGYRFVVICKAVEKINSDAEAKDKSPDRIHRTDIEYKESNTENPYRFAGKWYPEVITYDSEGNESTYKKTIEDYQTE